MPIILAFQASNFATTMYALGIATVSSVGTWLIVRKPSDRQF